MTGEQLRKTIAWTGTFALLAYLAFTSNLSEAWIVILSADSLRFGAAALVAVPVLWIVDSLTARWFLSRLGFEVRLREFAAVRGSAYLLGLVNYGLTLALLSAVVGRRTERGIAASGGAFLLLGLVDLGAMSLAVLVGLAFFVSPFEPLPTVLLFGAALGGLLVAPVLSLLSRGLAGRSGGLAGRLGRLPILAPFRDAPIGVLAGAIPMRMLLILGQMLMNFQFLRAFAFDIGLREVLVFMPLIGLIGVLPISVAGLGSTQIVARDFFGPFAPVGVSAHAAVDAVSTSSILGVMGGRALVALACLPFALRTGQKARAEASRADVTEASPRPGR